MDNTFRPFQPSDRSNLTALMMNLSTEDFSGWQATSESVVSTMNHLNQYPEKGSIFVFQKQDLLTGYAILINFWSNEYKGNVLIIDELYILPEFRSKGIARDFLKYLSDSQFNDSVMLQLEVSAENFRAVKLYESMGFKLNSYLTLKKKLI